MLLTAISEIVMADGGESNGNIKLINIFLERNLQKTLYEIPK